MKELSFGWREVEALSPLLILLAGIFLTLLWEVAAPLKKRGLFALVLLVFTLALAAALVSRGVDSPLLHPWVRWDAPSRFFFVFFLALGLSITALAEPFFHQFQAPRGEFYLLLLAAIFGLLLISCSADFLTLFIGLETLSLASYILSGYVKKWQGCGEAAIKYFIMGSLATAVFLYGIALFYGAFGTTHFLAKGGERFLSTNSYLAAAALSFMTVGLCFKAALVPFHLWAPDVYAGAPHPVAALMAVGTKGGAFAAISQLFLFTFPFLDPSLVAFWEKGLLLFVVLSLVYANLLALLQSEARRFFAYSGISHAAFLFLPILARGENSMGLIAFYLVIYSLATLSAFAVLAELDREERGVMLEDLTGPFWRSPLLASILAVALLTLAGIPLTAGFLAKLYLFKAAFEAGYVFLVFLALIVTVLAIFYYTRIVSLLLMTSTKESHKLSPSWPSLSVGLLGVLGLFFFSIYPEIFI